MHIMVYPYLRLPTAFAIFARPWDGPLKFYKSTAKSISESVRAQRFAVDRPATPDKALFATLASVTWVQR
jgi:hypothetical protein